MIEKSWANGVKEILSRPARKEGSKKSWSK
jgi:hypothetical protein